MVIIPPVFPVGASRSTVPTAYCIVLDVPPANGALKVAVPPIVFIFMVPLKPTLELPLNVQLP